MDADAGRRGAHRSGPQPLEPREVLVRGVDSSAVGELGSKLKRLASRSGAEIEDLVAGLGIHQLAEQLAPFVLHFEQPLIPGGQAVEVGTGGGDDQAVARPITGPGVNSFRGQPGRQLLSRQLSRVGAQTNRPREVECIRERVGRRDFASNQDRYNSSTQVDRTESGQVVARFSMPIYEGGEIYSRVRQAKHTQVSRIQEIEQQRAQAQQIVVQAWSQLQAAKAQLISDKAQIEANTTALQGTREEEKVGQRTLLDVLNAQQELLISQVQVESTKRNILFFSYSVVSGIGRLNVQEVGAVSTVYDPVVHHDEVARKWWGLDITRDDGTTEHVDAWQGRVEHEPVK